MYVFICMQPYILNHFMEVYQTVFISIWVYGIRRHVFSAPFFYFSRESSKWVSLENIYQVAAWTRVDPKGLQTDYIGKVIDDLFIYWGWGSLQKLKRFDFLFHVFMQLCAWSCTLCHTIMWSNGLTVFRCYTPILHVVGFHTHQVGEHEGEVLFGYLQASLQEIVGFLTQKLRLMTVWDNHCGFIH